MAASPTATAENVALPCRCAPCALKRDGRVLAESWRLSKIGKMADIVDPATRSRMMRGIKGKNTRPELIVRRLLHARGFRYRLHDNALPGTPDLVFPRYRAVVFVHGCFWHGHGCHMFRWPSSRAGFWRTKISGNQEADARAVAQLAENGWRIAELWECALRGKRRLPLDEIAETVAAWLKGDATRLHVPDEALSDEELQEEF